MTQIYRDWNHGDTEDTEYSQIISIVDLGSLQARLKTSEVFHAILQLILFYYIFQSCAPCAPCLCGEYMLLSKRDSCLTMLLAQYETGLSLFLRITGVVIYKNEKLFYNL